MGYSESECILCPPYKVQGLLTLPLTTLLHLHSLFRFLQVMAWDSLPLELVGPILKHATFESRKDALNISLVCKWARELAREALLYRVLLPDLSNFRLWSEKTIGFSREHFPTTSSPLRTLLVGAVNTIPELAPSRISCERASLVHHLWLIFSTAVGFDFQDHVHIRILLQLCQNVETLAITSVSLSHFLRNKREHFVLPSAENSAPSASCIHSRLTHLTIHSPIPPSIMDLEYQSADPCVQIFKQVTHLTIAGKHTRTGLPVDFRHFPALTHLAVPLVIPGFENIQHASILNPSMLPYMIGWDLLLHQQIQKIVFLFLRDAVPCRCSNVEEIHVCDMFVSPIVNANLSNRKAYILPLDNEASLKKIWVEAREGCPDIWERAEKIFEHAYEKHTMCHS